MSGFKSSLPSAFVQFDAASSVGEKSIPISFNANFPASFGGQEFSSWYSFSAASEGRVT